MRKSLRIIVNICACLTPLAFACPVRGQVANGGFETGDLTGWSVAGNGSVRVLTNGDLGSVVPPVGAFFALISNGPGDIGADRNSDASSLVSNPFNVPVGGGVLTFNWNFLTAEFTGADADPERLDYFTISLVPIVGSSISLDRFDVGATAFAPLPEGEVFTSDGIALFEQTGFRLVTYNIPQGIYSLNFTVNDVGDGAFDSALALDSVSLSSAQQAAAPEPGTLFLVSIGAIGAYTAKKRKTIVILKTKSLLQ